MLLRCVPSPNLELEFFSVVLIKGNLCSLFIFYNARGSFFPFSPINLDWSSYLLIEVAVFINIHHSQGGFQDWQATCPEGRTERFLPRSRLALMGA